MISTVIRNCLKPLLVTSFSLFFYVTIATGATLRIDFDGAINPVFIDTVTGELAVGSRDHLIFTFSIVENKLFPLPAGNDSEDNFEIHFKKPRYPNSKIGKSAEDFSL